MHTFLGNFHQGVTNYVQKPSQQGRVKERRKHLLIKKLYLSHPYKQIILICTAAQVLVEIVEEKKLLRQSAPFVKVLITLLTNLSKGSERKIKKLVRLVI